MNIIPCPNCGSEEIAMNFVGEDGQIGAYCCHFFVSFDEPQDSDGLQDQDGLTFKDREALTKAWNEVIAPIAGSKKRILELEGELRVKIHERKNILFELRNFHRLKEVFDAAKYLIRFETYDAGDQRQWIRSPSEPLIQLNNRINSYEKDQITPSKKEGS